MKAKHKALSIFIGTASLSLIRVLRGLGNLVVYPFIVASFGYESLGVFIVWYSIASGLGKLLTFGSSQAGFRDIGLTKNKDNLSKLYCFRLIMSLFGIISFGAMIAFFDFIPNYLIFLLPVILLSLADGPEWVANNSHQVEKLAIIKSICFCIFAFLKIWVLLNIAIMDWFYFIVSIEALCFFIIPYCFFPMKLENFTKQEIILILYSRKSLVFDNFFRMIKPRIDTWLVSFLYGPAIAGPYGYARQILYSLLIPAVAFTSVTLRVSNKNSNTAHNDKSHLLKNTFPYLIYGTSMTILIGSISLFASSLLIDINIPFYWIAVGSSIILPMSITAGMTRYCLISESYNKILKNNILFCLLLLISFIAISWFDLINKLLEFKMFLPLIVASYISTYVFFKRIQSEYNENKGKNFGY